MTENVIDEKNVIDLYIEDKKIVSVDVMTDTTPLGEPIYLIKFDDDTKTIMTMRRFTTMQTDHKSDATAMRAVLTKEVASRIYGLMMEYGFKFSEIDPTFNETVRLINDGQNAALDILWGNEGYDRSLLDVNRVLLTKYGEDNPESEPEPEVPTEIVPETPEITTDNDGIASSGSPVDTEDKV